MAQQLPARYRTQVRLGRDTDVEEWLAIDTTLDRPVLIRGLSGEATEIRRRQFVERNRLAATIPHEHLVDLFAIGADAGTYAVMEWNGGVSIQDRLAAGETLSVDEFLTNAAGLADALGALHRAGVIHGAIDPGAIQFSAAHPAKLGSFGRPSRWTTTHQDTAALATSLRASITGSSRTAIRIHQVAEALPRAVDTALDAAEQGTLDAAGLATALRSVPAARRANKPDWSWGWSSAAGTLVLLALGVAIAGLAVDTDPNSPFLFPATPQQTTGTQVSVPAAAPPVRAASTEPLSAEGAIFDPFGDGAEHDRDLAFLTDSDPNTSWRTENYFAPLRLLKPGVGIVFTVAGQPRTVEVTGSPGTSYTIAWASQFGSARESYSDLISVELQTESALTQLSEREGGVWLIWFTDLPEQESGVYYTRIQQIQFLP